MTDLVKQITEMTLQAELESHLAQDLQKNRKNAYTSKTMKTEHAAFELRTPRDRNGSFDPEIIKKSQTHMSYENDKVQINKKYVSEWSFKKDIIYIIKTVLG